MRRLGYTRYVAQGGDVGAAVTDTMGRQAPEGLVGIHTNLFVTALAIGDKLPAESDEERAAHEAHGDIQGERLRLLPGEATRPQTIGYALLDSPVALAAWMLDHDTDALLQDLARLRRRTSPRATSPGTTSSTTSRPTG